MSATLLLAMLLSQTQVGAAVPSGVAGVDLDGVLCDEAMPAGWSVSPDRRHARVAAQAGDAVLHVAPAVEGCAQSQTSLTLTLVAAAPVVDLASVSFSPDTGRLELHGKNLEGAQVRWVAGDRAGNDTCVSAAGGCTAAVPKDVDADLLRLAVLPAGLTPSIQRLVSPGGVAAVIVPTIRPARLIVDVLLGRDALSLERDPPALRVRHPEAIESVSCVDADCTLEEDLLVVRREHGADTDLELHLKLRPHWFFQGASLDPAPVFRLPIQRCPVAVASPPPLQGVGDQRIVIRIGGLCAGDDQLAFETSAGRAPPLRVIAVGAERYVMLALGQVGSNDQSVRVMRNERVWGQATTPTRPPPTLHARLRIEAVGPVDFLPTNRDAVVESIRLRDAVLEAVSLDGVYQVQDGRLRALAGISGAAPLHFAYRAPSLPGDLATVSLGELVEPIDREIHAADAPIDLRTGHVVSLQCGDGEGHAVEVARDVTSVAPFRSRNTCRLRFDRSAVAPESGRQVLSVRIRGFAADGAPRPDASRDQRVVLSANQGPGELLLEGVSDPFDRLVVIVSHVVDTSRLVDDANTTDGLRWTVVFGTQRARLYASATFPSGLFRVSEPAHSGVLTLNAGGLLRLVWLSRDGQESPLGLETGILWTSIAGDFETQYAPHGQVAIVTGLSVGIPIANAGHGAQTSVNLHAWLEFEVSRGFTPGAGSPWGFIIGPSLTVGDVGASF